MYVKFVLLPCAIKYILQSSFTAFDQVALLNMSRRRCGHIQVPPSYVKPGGTWCVLAPLLEQRHQNHIHNMGDYLRTDNTFGIFERLARLGEPESSSQLSSIDDVASAGTIKLSLIEALPSELLGHIMGDLSPEDIVSFAVCSKRLLSKLPHQVQQDIRNSVAWSNTPLICPFLYACNFPPAMDELFPEVKAQQDAFNCRDIKRPMDPDPIHVWVKLAFETFEGIEDIGSRRKRWLEAIASPSITQGIPHRILLMLKSAVEDHLRLKSPQPGEKWALRNLTTNEYFRLEIAHCTTAERIIAHVETAAPWLTLDAALLFHIYWSGGLPLEGKATIASTPPRSDRFKRGAWAGHCFDVVRCSEPLLAEAWKDVTESVVKLGKDYEIDYYYNQFNRPPRSPSPLSSDAERRIARREEIRSRLIAAFEAAEREQLRED